MQDLEPEQDRASAQDQHQQAQATPRHPRAGVRPRRVWSWAGALAAVLVIALLTTALIARNSAPKNSTPTVPLTHLRVYATSDEGTVRVLRADTGQVIWQAKIGMISGGKPVVDQGIVYVGSGDDTGHVSENFKGTVNALSSSDGKLLWSAPLRVPSGGPLVADGVVYGYNITPGASGNQTLFVEALRGSDGTQVWQAQVGSAPKTFGPALPRSAGTQRWQTPGSAGLQQRLDEEVVFDGVLYIGVSYLEEGSDGSILSFQSFVSAYHAADGRLLWRSQVPGGDLAVDEQAVYTDGVSAYSRSDGKLLWSSPLTISGLGCLNVVQGMVYISIGSEEAVYQASDGRPLWHAANGSFPNESKQGFDGCWLVGADGVVYEPTHAPDGALIARDGKTGKLLWRSEPGPSNTLVALLAGAGMVLGLVQNNWALVALDAVSGKVLWQVPGLLTYAENTAIVGTTVFVGSPGGYTAFNVSGGNQLWSIPSTEPITPPSALTIAP